MEKKKRIITCSCGIRINLDKQDSRIRMHGIRRGCEYINCPICKKKIWVQTLFFHRNKY